MRYRQLGKTDLRLSELSLGAAALGMPYGLGAGSAGGMPPPPDSESVALIHHAIDQGINFFDTARVYGRSEELLGKALRGRRQSVLVATKVSCLGEDGAALPRPAMAEHMTRSLHTSLRLLDTDYVDLLLLHSASVELLENSDAVALLKHFQAQGKARVIGASTYGTAAPRSAIAQGLDVLQVAYNILDQRLATALFPYAEATGTGIIVRSVFLKGVLSPRADYLPKHLAALQKHSRAVQQTAASLSPPQTREAAALQFVLAHESIATALVGVRDFAELETSLAAARAPRWSEAIVERFRRLRCDQANLLNPSAWGLP
ncbi:MAG: aldo/keto reductase [Chloroflexi bacterium]|nr:aldo/keto reductase [Chloroflexota bacterium]MCY4247082.1 aldo/keto reductase [Chloroflexota bacterium]